MWSIGLDLRMLLVGELAQTYQVLHCLGLHFLPTTNEGIWEGYSSWKRGWGFALSWVLVGKIVICHGWSPTDRVHRICWWYRQSYGQFSTGLLVDVITNYIGLWNKTLLDGLLQARARVCIPTAAVLQVTAGRALVVAVSEFSPNACIQPSCATSTSAIRALSIWLFIEDHYEYYCI